MKIMIVTPYFYPKIGGMENYAYNISKGLKEKYGWEVVVVTSNHEANKYKEERIDGMKIYRLPSWFKISNTPFNPFWYFQIKNIIQREKPNIVNGHTPVPYIADMAAIVCMFENIPYILTYQNDLVKNSFLLNSFFKIYYKTLGNLVFRISGKIIVSSAYYAEVSPNLRPYINKIYVISPGVEISRFYSTNNNSNSKLDSSKSILFVGQLDKTHSHKGLNYLIDAMRLVIKRLPDIRLVVVGKGNLLKNYINYAKKAGISKSVEFSGFVPEDKLSQYYLNSDVVVLPSSNNSEGFGMVLLEAGASKKPVIGTRVGGIPYVIKDCVTGFLVLPKDVVSLSEHIIKILGDKKLAKRLGENGYLNVVSNFTWNKQIKISNNLFASLI